MDTGVPHWRHWRLENGVLVANAIVMALDATYLLSHLAIVMALDAEDT